MTTKRTRYSTEFKLEAIKMVENQGRTIPEVATTKVSSQSRLMQNGLNHTIDIMVI